MKTKHLSSLIFLFALFALLIPYQAQALVVPPVNAFQLPWEQGLSWISMSGFDNGTLREKSSPHNYNMGGAVDFAPHVGMKIGEDTSNAWVTAAAAGKVIETSYCHIKIDHGNGWTTEYYHLGNIQVAKGTVVSQNQRLAIIDNNEFGQVCVGNRWPGPHLHFVLRPNMRDATLAGWKINYDQVSNITTFTKSGQTVGLFQPLLNQMTVVTETPTITPTTETPTVTPPTETPTVTPPTETPTVTPPTETPTVTPPTETPTGTPTTETPTVTPPTETPTVTPPTETPTVTPPTDTPTVTPPTDTPTVTPTLPTGLYVITVPNQASILINETSQVGVYLINVPADGLASVEFTCSYNPSLLEVSSIANAGLFGTDAVMALNGPQNGQFIFAVAGSNGRRATASGVALTFNVKGLQAGQSIVECKARVSNGSGTLTDIPFISATVTVNQNLPVTGTLVGSVIASKPVTVRLYHPDNSPAASIPANADGSFSIAVPAGTYTITASAEGFLGAQGTVTLTNNLVTTMSTISLFAGDIDGNNVIDQYDAMTIGMSYNTAFPSAADLNNDGTINVLDLELLAANYRKSGALMWQ